MVPAVGPADLASVRQAIADSLAAKTPTGSATPIQPALTGVFSYASSWAQAHLADQTIVVLISDGGPTDCSANSIAGAALAAGNAAAAYPPVLTYVIAFGASGPELTPIAAAGGTTGAYSVDLGGDVRRQILDYLMQFYIDAAS
ncbi:MAG: hypothetical protein JXD23_14045 [Spirochaetales bacterium]|nr:hypothetical protein [Spirochaetales bacterium]